MSRLLREYTPLAVAATGLIALVVVVVGLILRPADDEGLLRSSSVCTPAAVPAAGPAAEPNDGTAVMALHDAPRALPELRFKDGSGEPASLTDFRGKLVLLNVWATWRGPCREEMPTLDRLQATLGEPDFAVVALSIDRAGIGVVDAFYTEIGVKNLARYIDESGRIAQQLNALGLPTTLLLDREGRKIARHVGPAEWDTPAMVAFFRQHLSQQSGALRPGGVIKWAGEQSIHAAPALALPPVLRLAINEGISS
jgi:thiol-disulfide isomerase/thioredoxin